MRKIYSIFFIFYKVTYSSDPQMFFKLLELYLEPVLDVGNQDHRSDIYSRIKHIAQLIFQADPELLHNIGVSVEDSAPSQRTEF